MYIFSLLRGIIITTPLAVAPYKDAAVAITITLYVPYDATIIFPCSEGAPTDGFPSLETCSPIGLICPSTLCAINNILQDTCVPIQRLLLLHSELREAGQNIE